jgi:hypothetical protein
MDAERLFFNTLFTRIGVNGGSMRATGLFGFKIQ